LKNGKSDGYGIMEYADGDRYEGEWKDEKKHGYGKYTYADGRTKEGMWFEGKEVTQEELYAGMMSHHSVSSTKPNVTGSIKG
jgi:hypothetical protein